jgi:hypothetical protein
VKQLFLDVECYPNYFLALFVDQDGRAKAFEQCEGKPLDTKGLASYLTHPKLEIVTFNGNTYDIPICTLAMAGSTCERLFAATKRIIEQDMRPWDFYRAYTLIEPEINHVDLIEVAPGMVSLKIYGGRMHTKRLQDLPYEPGTVLTPEQMLEVKKYCRNDLMVTVELAYKLKDQIDLRRVMSKEYGVDLRSKSDAQIAEAVLKAETMKITGEEVKRKQITYTEFFYNPPAYIKFITPYMRERLEIIKTSKMVIKDSGHVEMPKEIESMKIEINGKAYKVGIGGLHSQESEVSHYATDGYSIADVDVTSYYPNLMLNMGMVPEAIGEHFTTVYRNILDERVEAKNSGDKVKADSLKITLNGTFGKTSNRFSVLYNPEMMVRTTLTGQLSLLMLIELFEYKGIEVLSANTDGIVVKYLPDQEALFRKCVAVWEKASNLNMEFTYYRSLHSRDVNNYIAVKQDGKAKTKGVYASSGLQKSPQNEICAEAVVKFLVDGTPVEDTIRNCQDIRRFITLRTVQGGAVKDGYTLGKAIRWYYATSVSGDITYRTNGNTVPRSEGAKPVMDLPDELPTDIDYDWYIRECREILMSLGVIKRPILPKIPRKNSKAWKELVDQGLIVEGLKGKWIWKEISE